VARIAVSLNTLALGDLGTADADARLLTAILPRNHRGGEWPCARGVTATDVERRSAGALELTR
jgi:hypothetical protein